MLHKKPNFKKEKTSTNGFVEGYKFKDTHTIDLTVETYTGGWENIDVSKEDRVLYILKGLGFAKLNGKTNRLEDGDVLEIPAGQEVVISGQLQFLSIKTKA